MELVGILLKKHKQTQSEGDYRCLTLELLCVCVSCRADLMEKVRILCSCSTVNGQVQLQVSSLYPSSQLPFSSILLFFYLYSAKPKRAGRTVVLLHTVYCWKA